jgi:hypothetical protein
VLQEYSNILYAVIEPDLDGRFEYFVIATIQVGFLFVTPFSHAVGYQYFGGPFCLCLQEHHSITHHDLRSP